MYRGGASVVGKGVEEAPAQRRAPLRERREEPLRMRFRVSGFGFGIWGLELGVCGLGFGIWGLGFGFGGLGSRVCCLGFGVWGLEFGV